MFVGQVLGELVDRLVSRPVFIVVLIPSVEAVADREAAREKSAYTGPGPSIKQFDHAADGDTTPRPVDRHERSDPRGNSRRDRRAGHDRGTRPGNVTWRRALLVAHRAG